MHTDLLLQPYSGSEVLEWSMRIQLMNFAQIIQSCLDEKKNLSKKDSLKGELHNYLISAGFEIEKTSMYRYFNPRGGANRMPGEEFIEHFANFLHLSETHRAALLALWKHKCKERVHRRLRNSRNRGT